MHFKPKKFLSLLTASLLAAGGLVGMAAAPAFADAPAPAKHFNYESRGHVSAGGNLGYEDLNPNDADYDDRDGSTWGDYVNDAPLNGDATLGTMVIKGTKGNGYSSIAIGSIGAANSLVSSTTRTVTMKFKAPEAGKLVRLTLQTDSYGAAISADSTTLTTGAWETLTFEFSNTADYSVARNRAAVFYDPASTVALAAPNNVMFIDNVSFNGGAPDAPAPATYFNYESQGHVSVGGNLGYEDLNPNDADYDDRDGSTWGDYVNDAPLNGDATLGAMVIKGTKGNGYSSIAIGSIGASNSLVSSETRTVTMKFKAPEAGKLVRLTLQTDSYGAAISATSTTQTTGAWQTLTFEFSDTADYSVARNRAAVFYDPASTVALAAPNNVMFIDNVSFNGGVAPQQQQIAHPQTLVTFESTDATDHSGTFCGVAVDDESVPPVGGSSGSTKSGKITYIGGGCDAYPLWTFLTLGAGESLISSAYPSVTMNFFSRTGGETPVLKLETTGGASFKQVAATEAVVPGWQTLTFTFSNFSDATAYRLATFFPQGTNVTSARTTAYYFDDVAFNGATTPARTIAGIPATPIKNYDVRLISSLKNTAVDANEFTGCTWLNCADNKYYFKMLEAGSTTTLTYLVTEHGTTTIVPSASVKLRINTSQSGSNATWTTSNGAAGAVSTSPGADGGSITASTNSSGLVSFDVTNTNTSGEAVRTLNDANPYPSACASPAGQTKGALQPEVMSVAGVEIGSQYVDVLWPHITSATINPDVAAGSDGTNCPLPAGSAGPAEPVSPFDMGRYPHLRLEKSLLNNKYDASWWDGVREFRDADTRAFLKYFPVGGTFTLTYVVTDENNLPMVDVPVSLIVNANYSCSKTFFAYEGSLIGPDDCSGGGETELPAKKTDSTGRVSFVLTNTNTTGEAMPADLNGLPNGKELGTNIKPNLVGAKRQGIDMLFAHFVESSDANKVTGAGTVSATIGKLHSSTFTFVDAAGKALVNTDIKYYVNGFDSKTGFAVTDAQGRVTIYSTNSSGQAGMQTVGVSLERMGMLPITATATVNWEAPALAVSAAGGKGAVVVKVAGAAGKTVKITIAGKVYTRVAKTENAEFSFATRAGKKAVKVSVAGKTLSKSVTVTKK